MEKALVPVFESESRQSHEDCEEFCLCACVVFVVVVCVCGFACVYVCVCETL